MEILNFIVFVGFIAVFFVSMSNIQEELAAIREKINK
jgi:hypothetical protein